MKYKYLIYRYNFYRDDWELVYTTEELKLAHLQLRQLRNHFRYHYFKLNREAMLDV